jgi:hypothetical protein
LELRSTARPPHTTKSRNPRVSRPKNRRAVNNGCDAYPRGYWAAACDTCDSFQKPKSRLRTGRAGVLETERRLTNGCDPYPRGDGHANRDSFSEIEEPFTNRGCHPYPRGYGLRTRQSFKKPKSR